MSLIETIQAIENARRELALALNRRDAVAKELDGAERDVRIAAVRLVRLGIPVTKVAAQIGVTRQTIHKWLKDKTNEPDDSDT